MATKAKSSENISEEQKYPIDTLRENSYALFGVSTSTFDGATVGVTGKCSVEEMKTIINKWLNKPIK